MNSILKRAIENLSELAELLSDEVVEQTVDQRLTPRGKACKEALQTAGVLTTKLHAITMTVDTDARQLELGGCASCNDP
jgi:hypothetical protein